MGVGVAAVTDATAYRAAKPWLDDGDLQLYHGDVLTVLQGLPTGIAQTCVTSPPYWGLRDYGTGTWTGGDPGCDHEQRSNHDHAGDIGDRNAGGNAFRNSSRYVNQGDMTSATCRCGAQRVDAQLGLEATPDQYVAKMVEVFREVRRVLRDDGTLWLNIGDSYATGTGTPSKPSADTDNGYWQNADKLGRNRIDGRQAGLKPKDLVGIPWRLAFALQADGWYLRSDIIWAKPNPMPESVTDRPTKAHEYVFLFSKQPRYYMDMDAVREPATYAGKEITLGPKSLSRGQATGMGVEPSGNGKADSVTVADGRNLRSVWQIATQPFPEAHFATYPEELVRRCILAGTSERGGCAECGAPWRRVVERGELVGTDRGGNYAGREVDPMVYRNGGTPGMAYENRTTGWGPTCACSIDDLRILDRVVPQLVLDPFCGSGTTNLVARKHGRHSIGIDLSADYLAIATRRTQQLSLLGGAA